MRSRPLIAFILLLAVTLPAQTSKEAAPRPEASISGTVTSSSGQPLKDAIVTAFNSDNPSQRFVTNSDELGAWEIKDILPGRYFLHAGHNGYANQAYGGPPGSAFGSTITIAPGQKIADIQIKLSPGAAIVGRVTDADGEPVLGVQVMIMRAIEREGVRHFSFAPFSKTTDDLGEYRFGNLLPGEYFIAVHEKAMPLLAGFTVQNARHEIFPPTFYSNTPDPQLATPIKLQAGDEYRANVSIQKVPTFRISGSMPIQQNAWAHLVLRPRNRDLIKISEERSTSLDDKGKFQFEGVPAGDYMLEATGYHGDHRAGAWVPLSVVGSDVAGISVSLSSYPVVRGNYRCQCPGEKGALSDHVLRLVPDNEESFGAAATARVVDGKFEFSEVQPGAYRIFPFDMSSDHRYTNFFLKSVSANGQDLLRQGVHVSPGTTLALEVVESSEGARLSGTISDKEGKPVGGALIDIVPDSREEIHRYVGGISDREGKFFIQGVPPGDYLVFPWSPDSIHFVRGIFQPYRNAAFSQANDSKAEHIHLDEGITKSLDLVVKTAE